MNGLQGYLKELAIRQRQLQSTVSELGRALIRLDQLERLDKVAQRIHRWQAYVLMDSEAPLLMRRANAWAVVGPGGIPDDVTVVGETMSLKFGEFGNVVPPDLQPHIEQGKVIILGEQFLDVVRSLTEELRAGRPVLPYHPGPSLDGETGEGACLRMENGF